MRQQRGWSLSVTSEKTGVSKAMLGQIERGESIPTIAILWKIAKGLEAPFSSFIDDAVVNFDAPIYRTNTSRLAHPDDQKIIVNTIFPYDEKVCFEVFIIELLPGCNHLSLPHEKNIVEHVIVIEGEMEIFANENWYKLKKNEGLCFSAAQAHGYRNFSSEKAIFHNIIHYPII